MWHWLGALGWKWRQGVDWTCRTSPAHSRATCHFGASLIKSWYFSNHPPLPSAQRSLKRSFLQAKPGRKWSTVSLFCEGTGCLALLGLRPSVGAQAPARTQVISVVTLSGGNKTRGTHHPYTFLQAFSLKSNTYFKVHVKQLCFPCRWWWFVLVVSCVRSESQRSSF